MDFICVRSLIFIGIGVCPTAIAPRANEGGETDAWHIPARGHRWALGAAVVMMSAVVFGFAVAYVIRGAGSKQERQIIASSWAIMKKRSGPFFNDTECSLSFSLLDFMDVSRSGQIERSIVDGRRQSVSMRVRRCPPLGTTGQ